MRLIAVAGLAAILATTAHADQSSTHYNVVPGSCGQLIHVPSNKPVILAGVSTVDVNLGLGQVALLRATKTETPTIVWAGTDVFKGVEGG